MLKDKPISNKGESSTVFVKIDSVLESLNHELVQEGAWINTIGQIITALEASDNCKADGACSSPIVVATAIWSAGAIKLDQYETAVHAYQQRSTSQTLSRLPW